MRALTRNKLLSRIISTAMALVLLVSLVPSYAFAADAEETDAPARVVEAAQSEGADETAAADAEEDGSAIAVQAVEGAVDDAPYNNGTGILPGTYTMTANIYVPAAQNTILGVNALPNVNDPFGAGGEQKAPTDPVYENATVTVNADGTAIVEEDIPNVVFTLQKMGVSDNAEVLEEHTVDGVYGIYTSRVDHLKIKVNDLSGKYSFKGSACHPIIMTSDWTVDLGLAIDFKGETTPHNYDLTDEASGMTLHTYTSTDLTDAKLSVTEVTSGSEYERVAGELKTMQAANNTAAPTFRFWNIQVTDQSGTLPLL